MVSLLSGAIVEVYTLTAIITANMDGRVIAASQTAAFVSSAVMLTARVLARGKHGSCATRKHVVVTRAQCGQLMQSICTRRRLVSSTAARGAGMLRSAAGRDNGRSQKEDADDV
jgi:hypothetical protein